MPEMQLIHSFSESHLEREWCTLEDITSMGKIQSVSVLLDGLLSRWQSGYMGNHGYATPASSHINKLRPKQNGRHFPDNIFKRIFLNESDRIPIQISLTFVHRGPINYVSVLVQIMGWRRPGDKPLSEPMVARLPTHICMTRPQWVKIQQTLYMLII